MSKYTQFPERGDIATYGADRKVKFIKYDDSYDGIPDGQTVFGTVAERNGKEVLIVNKTCESKKWAEVSLWNITGYTIDGAQHSFTLTANSVSITVTHSASTLAELAAAVNTAIAGGFGTEQYSCYVRDGLLILQHDSYTSYKAVTASGVSVTAWVAHENRAFSSCARRNGEHNGEGGVINLDRALIYFSADTSSTNYNPASDVTTVRRGYPICKPAYLGRSQYQSDHCAYLRGIYGEGEEGWIKFMEDMMLLTPSMVGNFDEGIDQLETYRLAGQTYKRASDGTEQPLYPSVDYAANVGYDAEGIEQGNWFSPGMGRVTRIQRGITYPAVYEGGASKSVAAADADIFTRSRNAVGATLVGNNSSVWSVHRYTAYGTWFCYGGTGGAYAFNFCNSFMTLPCVLYKLA